MEITVGQWLDSSVYPDPLAGGNSKIGVLTTGFKGLINVLEQQLGLLRPTASDNLRVAQWQQAMQQVLNHYSDKLYAQSFEIDPWNTAKHILQKRDELILAGWRPTIAAKNSVWLQLIAEIEQCYDCIHYGFADRVTNVLQALQQGAIKLAIDKIIVVDEQVEPSQQMWGGRHLQPWMIKLLSQLQQAQLEVVTRGKKSINKTVQSDLQKLQLKLVTNDNEKIALFGDGTLQIIEANQEWDSADYLTEFLKAHGTEQTVIMNESNNLLLSEYLNRANFPKDAVDDSSKARFMLQILPLAIQNHWEPMSIPNLMSFFTLKSLPFSKQLANELAKVIMKEPGRKGELWNQKIEEHLANLDSKKAKKNKMEIDLWINHRTYEAEGQNAGMPVNVIVNLCTQFKKWAGATKAYIKGQHALIKVMDVAIGMANELQAGVLALNEEKIGKIKLDRLIQSITGTGTKLPLYVAEQAPWYRINHPGALYGEAEQVIWWNFTMKVNQPYKKFWTKADLDCLTAQGIDIESPQAIRARDMAAAKQAVLQAKNKLVIFIPKKLRGEMVTPHPLWEEMSHFVVPESMPNIMRDAASLKGSSHFEGASLYPRQQLEKIVHRQAVANWEVPENSLQFRFTAHLSQEADNLLVESATSLEQLIRCPLKWAFRYGIHLKAAPSVIPNEAAVLGSLSHKIIESILKEHYINKPVTTYDKESINRQIEQLYQQYVPQMAGMLLAPHKAALYRAVLRELQRAIEQLHFFIVENELSIVGSEEESYKQMNNDLTVKGSIDILAKTNAGTEVIIDAKRSNVKKYREKLEEGAIQLAIYHWLRSQHEQDMLPVAYFMLKTADILTLQHDDFKNAEVIEGKSMKETMMNVQKIIHQTKAQFESGNVVARGMELEVFEDEFALAEEKVNEYKAECDYCDYKYLCGKGMGVQ